MLSYMHEMLVNSPPALARLGVLTVFVGLFWLVQNKITKFDDDNELFVKNNWAYLIQRGALVVAFLIAALPSVTATNGERWFRLIGESLELLWVFVALLIARPVMDKVLLPRFNNLQALLNHNVALAWTEAGFYVGFGFILKGSLTGASPDAWTGFASTVVFGALGLAAMVGVFFLHEWITPWDLRKNIYDNKLSAAIEVGGLLAASGIVISVGVAGDFTGWGPGLIAFVATVVFAVVMLYLFRWIIAKAILRGCSLSSIQTNNQVVAASLEAVLFVGVAGVIAGIVSTQL